MKSFKGRVLDPERPVFIYRNLTCKGVWFSVRQDGLVVGHTQDMYLRDVKFKVSERGRQRVLREKVKNVHAGILGYVAAPWDWGLKFRQVKYNPYEAGHFKADDLPIFSAGKCTLAPWGVRVEKI